VIVELGDAPVAHWLLGSPCEQEYVTVKIGDDPSR
jgi:hypothetical protein